LIPRATRNLQFVSETRSQTWIAEQSGIPRSTVGFVLRGERPLPSEYAHAARALYQREGYTRMRSEGFSVPQADRFKWYRPEAVKIKIGIMKEIVNTSTTMIVGQRMARDQKQGIFHNISYYWKQAKEDVQEGFRRSKKTLEDWEKYYEWLFFEL
jgi:hypothetical protein